ncbi:hypothetical protein ACS0TY_023673 [Phlomoides rotata]
MATTDNLIRREENINHLFFECKVTYGLWSNIIKWLGVTMVRHINPTVHFAQFMDYLGTGKKTKVAVAIWIGTVWCTWILRNEVIFNKAGINIERESCKIKINVWNWISSRENSVVEGDLRKWFESPLQCLDRL